MDQEVPNPFQATFPSSEAPTTLNLPGSPEKPVAPNGKTSRKTRSAPITRPRKTANPPKAGKAKSASKKRGRPAKVASATPTPAASAAAPVVKRTRKPKAVTGMKIELGAALNAMAGLKQEDAVLLGQIVTELLKKPKGARTRIIGALGKVLA